MYGINKFWALTSSDHDKVQTLILSGFYRTPNALGNKLSNVQDGSWFVWDLWTGTSEPIQRG